MKKEDFISAMKTLGVAFNREITTEVLSVYYEILKEESFETLKKAINEILKTKKYFPSTAELLEECKKQKVKNGFAILEFMKSQGYFHESEYGISEYDKACRWLETGVIPSWFKEDMKEYATMQKQLPEQKRLSYE